MKPPRLSILIPTYNRSQLLLQALDSIRHQTMLPRDLEIIVSNNCSLDDTAEVLRSEMLPGLRVFNQPHNLGPAANINFLLAQARGDLVFWLCDDDAIAPDLLEVYLDLFAGYPDLDILMADIELRTPDFEPLGTFKLSAPAGFSDGVSSCRRQLLSHHMVMSTMYRRRVLLEAGGWDVRCGSHMDCAAFCRTALRARRTFRVERPMLYFRISRASWSQAVAADESQRARWYRRKLDLLVADAQALAPNLLAFLRAMYAWHAFTVLCAVEIELGIGRLSGTQARAKMRQLLSVFPEGRGGRMATKVLFASLLGTWWLRRLRRVLGRPDPYTSILTKFDSY